MTLENQSTASSEETTSQDFQYPQDPEDPIEDVCTCDDCESQRDPSWKHRPEAFCDCHHCSNNFPVPKT